MHVVEKKRFRGSMIKDFSTIAGFLFMKYNYINGYKGYGAVGSNLKAFTCAFKIQSL